MDDAQEREHRLRRIAHRQGLVLRKSRSHDPHAIGYGKYWLVDLYRNTTIQGGASGISLDEVEAWLLSQPAEGS